MAKEKLYLKPQIDAQRLAAFSVATLPTMPVAENLPRFAFAGPQPAAGRIPLATPVPTHTSQEVPAATPFRSQREQAMQLMGMGDIVGAAAAAAPGLGSRIANAAREMVPASGVVPNMLHAIGTVFPSFEGAMQLRRANEGVNSLSDTDANTTKPVTGVAAVDKALKQGAAAPAATPDARTALEAVITRALTSGKATPHDIASYGALVPALTKQTQTQKDALYGQVAAQSQQTLVDQLEQARVDAGGDTNADSYKKAYKDHTAAYQEFMASLLGVDPSRAATAEALRGQAD